VIEPESVALWCALPLGVAVMIDSLEVLADRRNLRDDGLFGLPVLATGRPRTLLRGPLAGPLGALFGYPTVLAIPLVLMASAAVLLAAGVVRSPTLELAAGFAALTIVIGRSLLHLRNQFGLDGSNHMVLTSSTAIAAVMLIPDLQAQQIALYYVAAQLLLCYAAAGIAKAFSPQWRSGQAIPEITSMISYGTPALGAVLRQRHAVSLLLCWSVIAFECAAPLLILAGTPGAVVIVAGGLAFHVSIAVIMGLNTFLWSFASSYPALLYLAHQIDGLWQ
jgi:hypothetical protein